MSINRGGYQIPPETAPVVDLFEEMTEIPRPTGNEEGIRNWLVAFALQNGLESRIDERGNMAIDVPASPGRETLPRVLLQGHMDMVTMPGKNDVNPTKAHIDDEGWLSSDGTTTLGADNGIGVASALAIAKDKNFEHGPITILVTVNEEAQPMGIQQLDPGIVPEDAMFWVNLDSEEGAGLICRGCAAACDIEGVLDIGDRENLPEGYRVLKIELSGLKGGHSGLEIQEQRGNAIQLLAEMIYDADFVLRSMDKHGGPGIKLIDFSGGFRRNAIPSTAQCTVAVPAKFYEMFLSRIEENILYKRTNGWSDQLSVENAKGLKIEATELPSEDVKAIADDIKIRAFATLTLMQNGVYEQVPDDSGITRGVLLSSSLGLASTGPKDSREVFSLSTMARGAKIDALNAKVAYLKKLMKANLRGEVTSGEAGGAWLEDLESPAVQAATRAAVAAGLDPKIFAYHAGLECALGQDILEAAGRKRLPSVSIGPRIKDPHSENERVSIQSVDDTLRFTKAVLAELWNSVPQ